MPKMDLSKRIIDFYCNIQAPSFLPEGVEVMNPYENKRVMEDLGLFYSKYYNDIEPRVMLVGINPGRFGGGVMAGHHRNISTMVCRRDIPAKYFYR